MTTPPRSTSPTALHRESGLPFTRPPLNKSEEIELVSDQVHYTASPSISRKSTFALGTSRKDGPARRSAGLESSDFALPYRIPEPAMSRNASRAQSLDLGAFTGSGKEEKQKRLSVMRVQTERETEQVLLDPFRAPSVVLYFRACVIWEIWGSLLTLGLWTTLIVMLDRELLTLSLGISTTLLTVVGTVIGFVISYRTSSAYERYGEGRRFWSTVVLATRTLSRLIWLHVPDALAVPTPEKPASEEEKVQAMLEKKTAINLLEGFAVSLKHYLRGEHGIYYTDLYHLACFLPKYSIPSSIPAGDGRLDLGRPSASADRGDIQSTDSRTEGDETKSSSYETSTAPLGATHACGFDSVTTSGRCLHDPLNPPKPLAPAYDPPKIKITESLPVLALFRSAWKGTRNATGQRKRKGRYERIVGDDNIPLEFIIYFNAYVSAVMRRKLIDAPTTTAFLNAVGQLSDCLTNLERILTTPLPFGYSVHLKLVIWGYLAFLPFQLVQAFGYITIPAVVLVSFAFLGFLQIGQEIENPFGFDTNDLDLDHFCRNIIGKELAELTAWPAPAPEDFIFSKANMPLLPRDARSALDMARAQISPQDLQRALRHRAAWPTGGPREV